LIGPVDLHLFVHQTLSAFDLSDLRETVFLLDVIDPIPVHLAPQPLPPVDADLDQKRETKTGKNTDDIGLVLARKEFGVSLDAGECFFTNQRSTRAVTLCPLQSSGAGTSLTTSA
jgi:hypothetical protein